jgi:glycosyltransferase involved in cell wall biosynthesis
MITLVIPVIDQPDFTRRCLENLARYTHNPVELIIIDNGSEKSFLKDANEILDQSKLKLKYIANPLNVGVLKTFKQGLEEASGDILFFMHNDVLIWEAGWDERITEAFAQDPDLGMAGLLGARRCERDGGRWGVMSHMLGREWGQCEVQPAAVHHGELMTGIAPAVVFDGVGLMFRRVALAAVSQQYDLWSDSRPLHHFYDRNISLAFCEAGYHQAVIGIQFDHFSGATANASSKYHDTAKVWCDRHNVPIIDGNADLTVYKEAERQFFADWQNKLAVQVDNDYAVRWNAG